VRVLAVAERPPTALRSVVGGFPLRVPQERAQSDEMVFIQVELLSAQRSQRVCLGVQLPAPVALFGLGGSSPLSRVVLPDGELRFEKRARHTQVTPDRASQQLGELVVFLGGQVFGPMQE